MVFSRDDEKPRYRFHSTQITMQSSETLSSMTEKCGASDIHLASMDRCTKNRLNLETAPGDISPFCQSTIGLSNGAPECNSDEEKFGDLVDSNSESEFEMPSTSVFDLPDGNIGSSLAAHIDGVAARTIEKPFENSPPCANILQVDESTNLASQKCFLNSSFVQNLSDANVFRILPSPDGNSPKDYEEPDTYNKDEKFVPLDKYHIKLPEATVQTQLTPVAFDVGDWEVVAPSGTSNNPQTASTWFNNVSGDADQAFNPGSASDVLPQKNTDSEDEFGNFTSCGETKNGSIDESSDAKENTGVLEHLLHNLEPALRQAFLADDYIAEPGNISKDMFAADSNRAQFPTPSATNATWNHLLTVDHLRLLKDYKNFSIHNSYLSSIRVDARNAMPFFATQLRLLEPTRMSATSSTSGGNNGSESTNQLITSRSHGQPTSVNVTQPAFDWNSSGLTNPLDASSTGSLQLDLDFFEEAADVSKIRGSQHTQDDGILKLEAELMADMPHLQLTPSVTTQTNVITVDTISSTEEAVTSPVMQSVLSNAPSLMYMRSHTLMFPIKGAE